MQPTLWSISGLAAELEMDRRTVTKRLTGLEADSGEGASRRWYMARVVRHFHASNSADGALDPVAERARKDKEHADKLALENAAKRGELVNAHEVAGLWARLASETKTRLLSVPTKCAPLVIGITKIPQIQEILEDAISDALGSLGAVGAGVPGGHAAAPEADDQRMGGSASEAEPREQRRARSVAD